MSNINSDLNVLAFALGLPRHQRYEPLAQPRRLRAGPSIRANAEADRRAANRD